MTSGWGISYDELEPITTSSNIGGDFGKAGNLKGQIVEGGNPFESPRAREYPLPPLTTILASQMFADAQRKRLSSLPAADFECVTRYTNSRWVQVRRLQYCGYCQRFGCEANARAPRTSPVIRSHAQSELSNCARIPGSRKCLRIRPAKRSPASLYQCDDGGGIRTARRDRPPLRLCDQQCAPDAALAISEPYDPVTQKGVIGKNYCYQTGAGATCSSKAALPSLYGGGVPTSPSTTSTSTWVSIAGRTVSSAASASARATIRPCDWISPGAGGTPQWGKA